MSAIPGSSTPRYMGRADDPRRRSTRHQTEALTCDLGDVTNLSATGMCVLARSKPKLRLGQTGAIRLHPPNGVLGVTGRVVRLKRRGLRSFELGIEFLNVRPGVAAAIETIAKFGFLGIDDTVPDGMGSSGSRKPKKIHASLDLPDFYEVLGVAATASSDDVRDAYRALARKYHPDVSNDPECMTRFVQIKEAYEVLKDERRRQRYDVRRAS